MQAQAAKRLKTADGRQAQLLRPCEVGKLQLPCLSLVSMKNDLRRILPSVKPPSRTVEQLWSEPKFLAPLWACRIRIAHILLKCAQLSKVHRETVFDCREAGFAFVRPAS